MKKASFLHAIILISSMISIGSIAAEKKKPLPSLTPEQFEAIKRLAEERENMNELPLPESVVDYGERRDQADRAASIQLSPPKQIKPASFTVEPRPKSKSDEEIKTVYVYPNQITTFSLVDSMGEAWPMRAAPIVGAKSYTVHYDENIPGVFTLETSAKYTPSSLAMIIEGRVKPLVFQLRNNGHMLNNDVGITIKGRSPLNATQVVTQTYNIPSLDEGKARVFLTAPPSNAQPLATIGDTQTKIWRWNDKCVVLTPHQIMDSGTPIAVQSAPDNIDSVWLFERLPAVVPAVAGETGEIVRIRIISGGC